MTDKALLQAPIAEPKVNKNVLNKISESLPRDVLESKASSLLKYSQQYNYQSAVDSIERPFPVEYATFADFSNAEDSNQINLFGNRSQSEDESNWTSTNNQSSSYVNITDRSPRKKITWLKNYVNEIRNQSKTLIFDRKTAQTELSMFSELNSRKEVISSKVLESSHSVFEDQDKLANFSKKLKKIYNNVLIPDQKYDEIDDTRKRNLDLSPNYRKESIIGFEKKIILAPTEKQLFKKYCSYIGTNTDNLFDDAKISKEIEEDLKVNIYLLLLKILPS